MRILYRELYFQEFQELDPIINIGEIGRNFYIILSGSVDVMVLKNEAADIFDDAALTL